LKCPCEGLKGLDLAVCLGPPQGDYEVTIEIGNYSIIINNKGIFRRRIVVDDTLPFAKSITTPITSKAITNVPIPFSEDELVCMSIRALEEAAESGSIYARRRLDSCRVIVEEWKKKCS